MGVRFIPSLNETTRPAAGTTFVSSAFVVSSVSQFSPPQSASRIPKPCDHRAAG